MNKKGLSTNLTVPKKAIKGIKVSKLVRLKSILRLKSIHQFIKNTRKPRLTPQIIKRRRKLRRSPRK